MDFSALLPTFVITLREGVEAALVVGIVLACLKRAGQSRLNRWVALGVIAGILASALVGILFGWLIQAAGALGPAAEPLIEAGFSLMAIGLLSWMLIWMTQQARFIKTQVEGTVTQALTHRSGAAIGVFGLIFAAVMREGFETVVFIAAKFEQGIIPALGALAGLGASAAIGFLLFKWGVKLNLRLFFQVMGIFLLLIVAGLTVSTLTHFDAAVAAIASQNRANASLCFYYQHFAKVHSCILGHPVWNLSKVLPDDQFLGMILSALLGYTSRLYVVQAVVYVVFLGTMGGIYFQSLNGHVLFRSPLKLPALRSPLASRVK
jgi:high-affinity iron transporter